MGSRTRKIAIVEPDAEILEILVAALSRRFDAHITCVATAEGCLDVELVDPHDLIITELDLPDSDGLALTDKIMALGRRPVVILADDPQYDDAVEALRLGVTNLFRKPFPVRQLLDTAERAIDGHELSRRRAVKHRRMRDLVRRIIRERRDLGRRMELICRDLVGAQRGLVHRVLALEKSSPDPSA